MVFEPQLTPLSPTRQLYITEALPQVNVSKKRAPSPPASSVELLFHLVRGQSTGFSHPPPQPQVAEVLFWLMLQRGPVSLPSLSPYS